MSRPSRAPRTNAEAAVLALGNAIHGPGGTVETVRVEPGRAPTARLDASFAPGDVVLDPGGDWSTTPGIVVKVSSSKLGGTVVWANGGRQGGRWSAMDLVHREPRLRVPVPVGALGNRGWNREQSVRAALRRAGVEWTEEKR